MKKCRRIGEWKTRKKRRTTITLGTMAVWWWEGSLVWEMMSVKAGICKLDIIAIDIDGE